MRTKWFFLSLAVLWLLFGLAQPASATPAPPRAAINPTTLQCQPAIYWLDECRQLALPAGWEYLDQNACPAGYTVISDLKPTVVPFKNDFCCQQRGGEFCPQLATIPLTPKTYDFSVACLVLLSGLAVLGGYLFWRRRKAATHGA